MKNTYEIPSVEMTQLIADTVIMDIFQATQIDTSGQSAIDLD